MAQKQKGVADAMIEALKGMGVLWGGMACRGCVCMVGLDGPAIRLCASSTKWHVDGTSKSCQVMFAFVRWILDSCFRVGSSRICTLLLRPVVCGGFSGCGISLPP